ncbi:zinc-ribbon domain containing protein [Pseudomonadota bacterium]
MPKKRYTGRSPTKSQLREADRVSQLHPLQQRRHPTAVRADQQKLSHINTYGNLPEFYLDQPFTCRTCGKHEIWLAKDQKWYYEEAKGHIDAKAVYCHDCRKARKEGGKAK